MRKFIKGFSYAFKGIFYAFLHERNFRFHLSILAYMLFFLLRYDFFTVSKIEMTVILLMSALVLGSELLNTGIENACNAVTKEKNEFIKIAKDTASGGVLIFAIFSVVIGVVILYQPEAFNKMFDYFLNNPIYIFALALTLVIDIIFVLAGPIKIYKFLRGKKND